MGEKIVIGPVSKGLRNDVRPFNVDNDSFPTLVNAYQWRGRIKRKRGTSLLGRLNRALSDLSLGTTDGSGDFTGNIFSPLGLKGNITNATQANPCQITSVGHNLKTGDQVLITQVQGMTQLNNNTYAITVVNADNFTLNGIDSTGFTPYTSGGLWQNIAQLGAAVVPSSITITDGTNTFTDNGSGILTGVPAGSGTINYSTGVITITGAAAGQPLIVTFTYYPDLPVMGLEDFISSSIQFPGTIAFDTTYSYNISTSFPYDIYDVSFYKNPPTGTYPGYVQKGTDTPLTWNGQDYQQFWTTNYQGAMWATNGINVPFNITNIGMQYNTITRIAIVSAGPPAIATITTGTNHGLVIGDFVFINEVVGMTGINFQTGYVTGVPALNQITVEFPNATLGGADSSGGIVQYLTNRSDPTKDCIRWYDGDPTTTNNGWVNFCPPLSNLSYSIADLPAAQYYLVGARMIVPFKDRLLFLGPVVQTSTPNSQEYLPDTIIYSQNGTAYYTCSFTAPTANYPLFPTTPPGYVPILVPQEQTATPSSYFEDITGFGGFITAGVDQEIVTVGPNEDVLIVGFTRLETRLIYSGNDIVPFNFFIINAELGSGSTFSAVTMDKGIISRGSRGFIITSQVESRRIDLDIPDEIFQMRLSNNGTERVCAHRDYINEWIYFTYPVNDINYKFPSQTLQFNYRDNSWAIFRENYTTYGSFRKATGLTWATVGTEFPTWAEWNEPWNSGSSTLLQPKVIAGNQQGFVFVRDDGTGEQPSLYIQNIVTSTITSPNHCLNNGDYITISGALGTVGPYVNGQIFSVSMASTNSFVLNPPLPAGLTYTGGGLITRMYVPFIQSKQFPVAWGLGRKTRLGPQFYLLTSTYNSQITLLIFLSQDGDNGYNMGPIVPDPNSPNNSLIYSTVLYTCPESTNLGLTPANTNLQMVTAVAQQEIWHRINTSLLGDTVQVGFTMSDAQMRDINFTNQFSEIEIHGFILDVSPSQWLA